MAYSFNKAIETIVNPLVEKGRLKKFAKDPESKEVKDFFNQQNLSDLVGKLPKDSAEFYIGDLILMGVVNAPAKGAAGTPRKEREFVSPAQKAHYELYKEVTQLTEDFWAKLPQFERLSNMKREVERTRNGEDETVELAIEPMVYNRDSKAVIDSYEVA